MATDYFQDTLGLLRQRLAYGRTSLVLLSLFAATLLITGYLRADLFLDYYRRVGVDWLLFGIFLFMGIVLLAGANLRRDFAFIVVATFGGLFIEGWGTQTQIWRYYTEFAPYYETARPPWWIIPAWPISCLAINRMYVFTDILLRNVPTRYFTFAYWPIYAWFNIAMFQFYQHTLHLPFTWIVLLASIYFTLRVVDSRRTVLLFLAGSALGYFLEYWGTTRICWIYYTGETPPAVAVFAHGAASVVFARVAETTVKTVSSLRGKCNRFAG